MKMSTGGRVAIVVVIIAAIVVGVWSFMQGQKASEEAAGAAARLKEPKPAVTRVQPPSATGGTQTPAPTAPGQPTGH